MKNRKFKIRLAVSLLPIIFYFAFITWKIFISDNLTGNHSQSEFFGKTPAVPVQSKDTVTTENEGVVDTVKIGAYIYSIYDLDFPANKLNVDMYLWYNTTKDSMNLLENLEIINAVSMSKSYEMNEKRGNIFFHSVKINATIKQEWDVTDFPFDKQNIEIKIEDFDKDNSKMVFIADTAASKIDKDVHLDGWQIKNFGIKVNEHIYETNYGDPDIPLDEYSVFSQANLHFTLEREGKGLFFKLFVGLFISVLISLLTFFINPLDLDPRFGLSVGAIFAAIASQYVITSTLPQNERLTLVDILHDISFIFIFICILISTISLHLIKTGREELYKKLDRRSFYIFASAYIILVLYFILKAI